MNILKEKIKLFIAYPEWHVLINKMKKSNKKKVLLIGTPVHGNLGDHAIAVQEQYFFYDYLPEYEYYEILMPMYHIQKHKIKSLVNKKDLIVVSGGGWMGNLWIHNEYVIREIIKNYPENKIIILPQTIYYSDDKLGEEELAIAKKVFKCHKNLHIFVRDEKSYELVKKEFNLTGKSSVQMAPDMVLYGKNITTEKKWEKENAIINICIREDRESEQNNINLLVEQIGTKYNIKKISTVIKSPVKLKKRMKALQESWEQFALGEITITDRLHAMLFSILNGTPCIALDNKTGKVFGVAKWIEDTGMVVKANTLDDIIYKLDCGLDLQHKKYERKHLLQYFEKMADEIRKD